MDIRGLDSAERRTLAAVILSPLKSIPQLSRDLGYREHKVRYIIKTAFERGLILTRCFLNLNRLGYMQFEVFCNFHSKSVNHRSRLIEKLINMEQISWLGELGGEYQFGFNCCVKNTYDLLKILQKFEREGASNFSDKDIAIRIALYYFGKPYISPETHADTFLFYESSDFTHEIDQQDHLILQKMMLQQATAKRSLARECGIPASTLEYRIKNLEERGIIVGYYNSLRSSLLGIQSFLVLIGVRSGNEKFHRQILEYCKKHQNISILIRTIGNWDYELVIDVVDPREVSMIAQEISHNYSSNVRFTKIIPSFAYHKIKEYPFTHLNS